jgi:medium-chain acyl-[acyl-carrier-protein] hydrolase
MLNDKSSNIWFDQKYLNYNAKVRLFCLPYAGGNHGIFSSWADILAPHIEICPALLPGRSVRFNERPINNLRTLVSHLAQAIQPLLTKPYWIYGHSMGGIIGYELASSISRSGLPIPDHLYISGARAPHVPIPATARVKINSYKLPDQPFIEQLKELNGTPPEVFAAPELLEIILPILRADFAVVDTYEYKGNPPLTCPISAFGGLDDISDVPIEALEQWKIHTTGQFSLKMLTGDHFFVWQSEQIVQQIFSPCVSVLA